MKEDPTLKQVHDVEDIRRGAVLRIDVETEGGKKLLQLTEALLADRLDALMREDAYCAGLIAVLDSVGYHIRLAADKSARLMTQRAMGG